MGLELGLGLGLGLDRSLTLARYGYKGQPLVADCAELCARELANALLSNPNPSPNLNPSPSPKPSPSPNPNPSPSPKRSPNPNQANALLWSPEAQAFDPSRLGLRSNPKP